jgi:hypothetical protein
MPIVQDRLIKLVAHANVLLDAFDGLKANTKALAPQAAIIAANSALDHVNDKPTKDVIQLLAATISQMASLFTEIEIPQELRNNISEERIHFKLHRKANEHMRNYVKYKRIAEANMAAAKAQIPVFFKEDEPQVEPSAIIETKEPENTDPEFTKVQAALHKKFWPAAPASQGNGQKPQQEPQRQCEPATTSGASATTEAETQEEIRMRSSKYAPGVIATSAPTNDEQNKIGIATPDKDLF